MKEYHKINGLYKRFTEGPLRGQFKDGRDGNLPEFARDEFLYLFNNYWVGTEKIDGTNIRMYYNGLSVEIKGRTDKAQIPSFLQEKLDNMIIPFDDVFGDEEVTLYGEGYGARIQKGGGNYISDGVDFILFDVRIGNWWLKRKDVQEIAEKLCMKTVPVVFKGTLSDAKKLVKDGFQSVIAEKECQAEGLVLTPIGDFLDRSGKRIITKLKTKDYD